MTDLNPALVQQFLHVSVAERKAVVQPDSMLDNRHRKSVAVGFGINHSGSAYPEVVKATQLVQRLSKGQLNSIRRPGTRKSHHLQPRRVIGHHDGVVIIQPECLEPVAVARLKPVTRRGVRIPYNDGQQLLSWSMLPLNRPYTQ